MHGLTTIYIVTMHFMLFSAYFLTDYFIFLFSVISVPEGDFFFDFVRHLMEWLKKTRATSASMILQLYFSYSRAFGKIGRYRRLMPILSCQISRWIRLPPSVTKCSLWRSFGAIPFQEKIQQQTAFSIITRLVILYWMTFCRFSGPDSFMIKSPEDIPFWNTCLTICIVVIYRV